MIKRILLAATLLLSGNLYAVTISGKPTAYTFNGSWTGANSTPAPTSYYHFDEGSGTALADIGTDGSYDISSFTGTPDWQTCGGVDCLNFDGSTEWIDVAGGWGTAQSTTDLTICAIHIADAHGAQDSTIVGVGNTSSGNDDYLLMGNNTAPKYNAQYRLNGTLTSDIASSARDDSGTAKFHCLVWDQSAKNATVYEENGTTIGVSANPATIGAFTNNVGRIAGTPESGTPSEIFDGKIVALYIWKSTALSAAQIQDVYNSDDPWPFLTPSGSCPATCAGGRSARCITDISDASDADNILYGLSPAATANEDTVCYDPSSVLGDTVNVSAAGWPSFASGGSQLTDSFDYCIMDNGDPCGTDGTYEVTFQPVISSVTGIGTGQTTADITVTPSGPTEGTVQSVAISKTSYDTYGAPSHAQAVQGVDANDDQAAWASIYENRFLTSVPSSWAFTRATVRQAGTDMNGLITYSPSNLLTYSEQFDLWSKPNVSVTANQLIAPNGTLTADLVSVNAPSSNRLVSNSFATTGNTTYIIRFWIYGVNLSTYRLRLWDETNSEWLLYNHDFTGNVINGQWVQITIPFTTAATTVSCSLQLLRDVPSVGTFYIWGAQLNPGLTADEYVPTTSVAGGADKPAYRYGEGILLEGSRTNLLKYSEQFDNAAWTKNAATISATNITAPDGNATADTLKADAGTATLPRFADTSVNVTAGPMTVSVYAKAGTYTYVQVYLNNNGTEWVNFDLSGGTASANGSSTATITPVGEATGWYRLTMTYTAAGTDRRPFIMLGASASATRAQAWSPVGTETVHFSGTQLEVGSFASSYIPTTTASVTRAATSLTKSHTLPVNGVAFQATIYPRFASTDTANNRYIATFLKDANNYLMLYKSTTAGEIVAKVAVGGTTATATIGSLSWAAGDKLRVWVKKTSTGLQVGVNGSAGTETTTGVADDAWTTPPDEIIVNDDEDDPVDDSDKNAGYFSHQIGRVYHEAKTSTFLNALQ